MKKVISYVLLFLAVITTGYSQVVVGTGTYKQEFVPFNPSHSYSYSQTIYLADEISSSAGDITSVGWYYQGVSNIPNSQDITIYMGLTDKKNFDSAKDYVPVGDLIKVYEGPIITNGAPGWKTLVFNQVEKFNWDGAKNIIIAVDENHSGGDPIIDGGNTPADKFYCTEVSSYRSIVTLSAKVSSSNEEAVNIDPASPNKTNITISQKISAYIPNILLGIQQSCPAPTELAVTNIKANSATIFWKILDPLPSGTSEYFITQNSPLNPIIPNRNTVATGTLVNGVADNIPGLKHSTNYKIWIRNRCSDTDTGNWSEAYSFSTLCDINTNIYVQNFDAITTPILPNCWKGIVAKIDGASSATVVNGGVKTAALTGNGNALIMNNANSSGDYYIMAISPELDNMYNGNYRLKFSAKVSSVTSGSPTYLEIGTVTLNSDGTFTNYEVVKENIILTASLIVQEPINFLAGMLQRNGNKRIAFRIGTNSPQQKFIYVDDIHWEPIPACGDISAVSVVGVQGTDVSIGWNLSTQADSTTGDIVITEDPLIVDPSGLTPKLTNVPTPSVLTNLKENTTYRAWVRSNCGANKGSYIGPVTFTTNCAYKNSFEENFDGMINHTLPACWSGLKRNTSAGAKVETNDGIAVSGHNSVRLYAGGSFSAYEIILVSPPLSNLNQGTYRVRFYSKDKFEVGTLNNSSESATFTSVKSIAATGNIGGMIEQTVNIPSTTDSHLAFRMVNESDFSYPYKDIYIDNIIWEPIPACVDVKKPTLNKISTDSAQIVWTPGGGEGKWHVTYSTTNVLPTTPTFTTVLPESGNLVGDGRIKTTINGLSASSTYYVWVRSNCDVDNSTNLINGRWIGPIAITTECNDVQGYSENFDTVSNPNLPSCWSAILAGGEGVLSPYASIKTNDGKIRLDAQFSLPEAKIILVGPNTRSLGELNTYRLKFDFEYRQNIKLEIGTLDGKLATATYTPLKQVELNSSSEPSQIVYFNDVSYSFNGIDNHIGIRLLPDANGQAPSVVLDNITWEKIPTCLEVSAVTVKSTTINSAILSWVKGKTETAWQISVNPVTAITPSTADTDIVAAGTNADFSLNNLKDSEQYKIWIRSKCSDTDFSGWSSPVIFNTKCNASNLPFVENFEQITALNLPICGSTFTGKVTSNNIEYTSTPWNIYLQNRNGFNSNTMRYAGNANLTGNAWYFTKGINLEAGKSYAISYLYGSNMGLNTASRLEVKFGTDATVAAMSTSIADHKATGEFPNISYFPNTATPVLKTFTVPTTGVYYFGYYAYSLPSQTAMFIDDIKIDVNLSSDEFKTDLLRYYPNPVTDVLNISYISNITSVSVYNMLGQEVIRSKANGINTINQIDMSQLNNGTYMVRISADDLTKTIKVIKQ